MISKYMKESFWAMIFNMCASDKFQSNNCLHEHELAKFNKLLNLKSLMGYKGKSPNRFGLNLCEINMERLKTSLPFGLSDVN